MDNEIMKAYPRHNETGKMIGYKPGPAPTLLNGCAVVGYLERSADVSRDEIRVRGGEVFYRDNYVGRILPGCLEVEAAMFSFFSLKALKRICEILEEREYAIGSRLAG